tara:strand:+ start:12154 stop:12864 length:711 start_codon:yes stop_codon:yes gene_type:complete
MSDPKKKKSKSGYQKINWDDVLSMPSDPTKEREEKTSDLTSKKAYEKAKYEETEEYKVIQDKKKKIDKLSTESKLKKAEIVKDYEESPESDYDRYLKKAGDYYKEGYSTKTIPHLVINKTTVPPDTSKIYRNIAIPNPGQFAESAREGVQAYTDSMDVSKTAMDLGMRTTEVRELENNFKKMTRDKVKELSQDPKYDMNDPNVQQYIMQQVAYNFAQKYGERAKRYLESKNIPVVQ